MAYLDKSRNVTRWVFFSHKVEVEVFELFLCGIQPWKIIQNYCNFFFSKVAFRYLVQTNLCTWVRSRWFHKKLSTSAAFKTQSSCESVTGLMSSTVAKAVESRWQWQNTEHQNIRTEPHHNKEDFFSLGSVLSLLIVNETNSLNALVSRLVRPCMTRRALASSRTWWPKLRRTRSGSLCPSTLSLLTSLTRTPPPARQPWQQESPPAGWWDDVLPTGSWFASELLLMDGNLLCRVWTADQRAPRRTPKPSKGPSRLCGTALWASSSGRTLPKGQRTWWTTWWKSPRKAASQSLVRKTVVHM